MKTILHIAEAFGGGILTFVANLANEQSSKYNVVVAHGMRYETHKDYKRFFKENIKLVRVENFDYFDQKISIRKEFAALKELRRVICKVKPDIIHMHSSQSGVLGKLASWDYKVPKVYSPHGFAFLKQDTAKWKKWFYKLIEKAFAMGNCTLVASSKTEFEEARKITRKAVLIKNGINTIILNPYREISVERKSTGVVGMVGRALPQKNPSFFNRIAEMMPHVHFEWIGDGKLRDELKSPNIHVVGWGPREEALEYVAKSDVYIMTSLWEGMPLSLLEAMYMGKPCVVTNVVGNRDVIEDGKNGFICETEEQFVEKINYLLNNPTEGKKIGKQAQKDVLEKYNIEIMSEEYSRIYNC